MTSKEKRRLVDSAITTSAIPATLASSALGTGSVARVEARVVAQRPSDGVSASWHVAAAVKRAGAGSAALVGASADVLAASKDTGASAWAVAIKVTGNNAYVEVTGASGSTIEWMADVTVRELRV